VIVGINLVPPASSFRDADFNTRVAQKGSPAKVVRCIFRGNNEENASEAEGYFSSRRAGGVEWLARERRLLTVLRG